MSNGLSHSPRTWQLLAMLGDGKFHSGEVLANRLGISRASVFNALANVAEYDVVLQRIRGRGYRLARPWQRLDTAEITRCLGQGASQFEIEILPQASSSNALLLQRARSSKEEVSSGSVLAVELQTAGRGRMGRVWHSGLGSSLTFSLLWRFACGLNALSGLSLAVGVAQIRTLKKLGSQNVYLKWPNDIMTSQGKLGGVLIEAQGDMLGPCTVVIGIGLNYSLPATLVKKIDQAACALDDICTSMPTRSKLLAMLLQELVDVLKQFEKSGFALLRTEWESYHIHQNRKIMIQVPQGKSCSGFARGVNDRGELYLETKQGSKYFNSGEIGEKL